MCAYQTTRWQWRTLMWQQMAVCKDGRELLFNQARIADRQLCRLGVTLTQLSILREISVSERGLNSHEVGCLVFLTKADVSRGVTVLLRVGLIAAVERRKGVHRKKLFVTNKGVVLLKQVQ
jgi:DNA-binding MarR family transcriptional regulator